MSEFVTVLNAVIPIFGIMVIGLVIRRLNWLTEEADQSLLRVTVKDALVARARAPAIRLPKGVRPMNASA